MYQRRYSSSYQGKAGQAAAREQIEQARAFSRELGGTDADVKAYFFSLSDSVLDEVLSAYGKATTPEAESWARQTFPRWKSGATQMSGLVAQKLFALLPPRMPPAKRLELAENIWQQFGPRSVSKFTVGPNADVKAVLDAVYARLDTAIEAYQIPEEIRARFEWLSAGNMKVKELLFNYFLAMERKIASEKLQQELPVLQKQMREYGNKTVSIRTTIDIQRHSVIIYIDRRLDSVFCEDVPVLESRNQSDVYRSLIVLIGVTIVIVLIIIVCHPMYTQAPAISGGPSVGVPANGSISFAPAPQKPIIPAPLPIPSATEPAQRSDVAPEGVYSRPNSTVQSSRLSIPPATKTAPPQAPAISGGPSVGVPANGPISFAPAPQKPIDLRPPTASLKPRPPAKIFSNPPEGITDPTAFGVY